LTQNEHIKNTKKVISMAKKTMSENRFEPNRGGGLFIPAGLFVGMGIGFLINNIAAGIFGGLGIGFVCFALITVFKKA
jgi:hypothetical protein